MASLVSTHQGIHLFSGSLLVGFMLGREADIPFSGVQDCDSHPWVNTVHTQGHLSLGVPSSQVTGSKDAYRTLCQWASGSLDHINRTNSASKSSHNILDTGSRDFVKLHRVPCFICRPPFKTQSETFKSHRIELFGQELVHSFYNLS